MYYNLPIEMLHYQTKYNCIVQETQTLPKSNF